MSRVLLSGMSAGLEDEMIWRAFISHIHSFLFSFYIADIFTPNPSLPLRWLIGVKSSCLDHQFAELSTGVVKGISALSVTFLGMESTVRIWNFY